MKNHGTNLQILAYDAGVGTGIKITIKKLTDNVLVLHEDFSAAVGQTFVADMEYHKKGGVN